jgi:L-alanine-DL-glutamate epimerase-like enolase superfamily enzyme
MSAVIETAAASLIDLSLRTTFRTHWKTIRQHRSLKIRLTSGAVVGEGEAYTLEPEVALREANDLRLVGRSAWEIDPILDPIPNPAVRSAIDLALHDLLAKIVETPVYRFLGVARGSRETCVSVGIDEPERMVAAARGWIDAGYGLLKIKLTTESDLAVLEKIRAIGGPTLRLWVDANQAYEPQQAIDVGRRLADLGVEVFEQPLPVGQLAEYAAIASQIPIPILLDEEVRSSVDVARAAAAGGVGGVNVKLAKFGGIREALRAIHVARAHRLDVCLGCYFESSLGISGSAHLLAFADRVDLDAPLFLDGDPYVGLQFEGATLTSPVGPGLGVRERT